MTADRARPRPRIGAAARWYSAASGAAPMPSRSLALLFALSLSACAAHEGPPTADEPPPPRAAITAAIASVQLIRNCDDPASEAPAQAPAAPLTQAAAQAIPPAQPLSGAALRMPGDSVGWSQPCTQSTMQLALPNTGDRDGKIHIESVRLLDAVTKRELGDLVSRKPHQWNPQGSYQPWDERVPAKATIHAAYRLADPDWSQVQRTLGADVDLFSRSYLLEVRLSVDGADQTVRSAEFVRQPEHIIAT